MTIWMKE